jgi:NTE family protein
MHNQPAKTKIGLALSGGVARGPAHLGVLLTLLDAGLTFDYISGASAGALIGAVYCAGLSPTEMIQLAGQVGWRTVVTPAFAWHGLVSFRKMEWFLEDVIGPLQFNDLQKPLAVVATDVRSGEPITICSGRVARAVRASCSVPGVATPVYHQKHLLADGGASCNLPSLAARSLGADFVIGVDLFQAANRPYLGALNVPLATTERLLGASGGGRANADFLITPQLAGETWVNFAQRDRFIELGAQAARAALPALKQALAAVGKSS